MAENSAIGWTDHTFNIVMGCQRVSEGCVHCYAEQLVKNRMGLDVWGDPSKTERKSLSDAYWKKPLKWNRDAKVAGKRLKVFVGSLCDWAEDQWLVALARKRLFAMTKQTPYLDYLLLTKRADNIVNCLPEDWGEGYPNVWLGVSVENQKRADQRIPVLSSIPAVCRFLSVEPLLEHVNLRGHLLNGWHKGTPKIHWVIVGGESGPGFRPFDAAWATAIRDQCAHTKTAFFFKQHGGTKKIDGVAGGHLLDGKAHYNWPTDLDRSWIARDEHGCLGIAMDVEYGGWDKEIAKWEARGRTTELVRNSVIRNTKTFGCAKTAVQKPLF